MLIISATIASYLRQRFQRGHVDIQMPMPRRAFDMQPDAHILATAHIHVAMPFSACYFDFSRYFEMELDMICRAMTAFRATCQHELRLAGHDDHDSCTPRAINSHFNTYYIRATPYLRASRLRRCVPPPVARRLAAITSAEAIIAAVPVPYESRFREGAAMYHAVCWTIGHHGRATRC